MDEERYRLRELEDADLAALARIWTRNDPDRPITEPEVRDMFRWSDQPQFVKHRRSIVDRATNEVVGNGTLWQNSLFYRPDYAFAAVSVDPDHQRRGLGRRLYEDLEAAARALQLKGLWAGVRADQAAAVRFFERTGFREQRRNWTSRLDVRTAVTERPPGGPERWAQEGIVFSTIREEGADQPEVRARLHRLYLAAMKDTPRLGGVTSSTFEDFTHRCFEGAGYRPEAMFVARVGDEYVAFSLLFAQVGEPGVLHISFTGTLPAYRGRGLAGELKRRSVEFARANGYRFIETDNDSENQKIWSINRQLGFRQFRVFILGEKELSD